jgi:hypothetical protein
MTKEIDEKLARAYIKGQKAIDAFDRRDANKLTQLFAIDRKFEQRRAKRFQPLGEPVPEILGGEFSQAAE